MKSNFPRNALFHTNTKVYPIYFGQDCRLEFKQNDVNLTKEQSVPAKIKSSFEGENIQTQYNVLGYRIDICFHDHKIVILIDENVHMNRNIDFKMKSKITQ